MRATTVMTLIMEIIVELRLLCVCFPKANTATTHMMYFSVFYICTGMSVHVCFYESASQDAAINIEV